MIRAAFAGDRENLAPIPAAAQFLNSEFIVLVSSAGVVGFLAWRRLVPEEVEILHLEIDPAYRRAGWGRKLLQALKKQDLGDLFLEVRSENMPARRLYRSEGFESIGVRHNYYSNPLDDAIVLRFHPC